MCPQKLTFREAWESSTIFYVNHELEKEIDDKVSDLISLADDAYFSHSSKWTIEKTSSFLKEEPKRLEIILRDIGLSDEKFMRVVSLLRKLGQIPGGFDSEWHMSKIKSRISQDDHFVKLISQLILHGKNDKTLEKYIPRFYLDKLCYSEIGSLPQALRKIRFKESTIGTYGARKGHCVESEIKKALDIVKIKYGIGFEKGRSRFINVDIDFAIPSLEDPWIIIMSSFQETTSSGQTTKARDMLAAYTRINESNSRFGENRAFVNFVDGGGWLARKRDFERLVSQCHYFINLNNLAVIEPIVLAHIPQSYKTKNS